MAKVPDPRTGETTFTDPQDEAYTRAFHNSQVTLRGQQTALFARGLLKDRPLPGKGGVVYEATDENGTTVYWDTGSRWVALSEVGGGGAPRPPAFGGNGSTGSSSRAAPLDHVHPMPFATPTEPGAMSAEYAALLSKANGQGNPGIAMYDSRGGIRLGAHPLHNYDAATRGWVLDQVSTGGGEATIYATPGTIPRRDDVTANFRVGNPSHVEDVVNLRTLQSREDNRDIGYLAVSRITYGSGGYQSFLDWINGRLGDKAAASHMHNGSDIRKTGGAVPWEVVTGSTAAWDNTGLRTGSYASVMVDEIGRFSRYVSARKYKTNEQPWRPTPAAVLALRPTKYDAADGTAYGLVGFMADDYKDTLPELVQVSPNTGVEGMHYHLVPVAQQVVLQDHEGRLQQTEALGDQQQDELDDHDSRLARLEQQVRTLTGGQ